MPHLHENHETALYVLSGEAEMWFGESLTEHMTMKAGDYVYIPAGVAHPPGNPSLRSPLRLDSCPYRSERAGERRCLRPDLDPRELSHRDDCTGVVVGLESHPRLSGVEMPSRPVSVDAAIFRRNPFGPARRRGFAFWRSGGCAARPRPPAVPAALVHSATSSPRSSALVDKDERGRIEASRLGPPCDPCRLVPLTCVQDFF